MLLSHRLTHSAYINAIEQNAHLAHTALTGLDPAAPVPDCPDWPSSELRDHISGVFTFWSHQLSRATTAGPDFPDSVRAGFTRPIPESAGQVISALRALDPDETCWNWSGEDMTAAWVARRMAHEIAVHRIDAQRTAGPDSVTPIDSSLATDGIDEMLDVHVGNAQAVPVANDPILRIVTPEAQWTVSIGKRVARIAEHTPSAAAALTISGPPDLVLLRLWGRDVPVDLDGDQSVMQTWQALPVFDQ